MHYYAIVVVIRLFHTNQEDRSHVKIYKQHNVAYTNLRHRHMPYGMVKYFEECRSKKHAKKF